MTEPLFRTEDERKVDAVWGDPTAWEAAGRQWGTLPAVRRMMNRHVTGDEALAPIDWFFRRVEAEQSLPLRRGLVLACGDAGLERALIRTGRLAEVVAVDLSPRVIATAAKGARDEGLTGITYRQADMNALDVVGPFDAVFSSSALHHCENLEGAFEVIRQVLRPGGWFFLDDYVGPDRLQYDAAQVMQINRLLQVLPENLVTNAAGYSRRGFRAASVAEVIALDPSEAPRSSDILSVMRATLAVEAVRPYGGNLLYLALANLAQNFEDAPEYLELLIDASDHLRSIGRCRDDFAVAVARHAIT
jgi:SAM-dependent methyltransferase